VRTKVREGSPGKRSGTTRDRIVKQVGFKPGVKERGCYGRACGETEEEEVIGEGIGESEVEELVLYQNEVDEEIKLIPETW